MYSHTSQHKCSVQSLVQFGGCWARFGYRLTHSSDWSEFLCSFVSISFPFSFSALEWRFSCDSISEVCPTMGPVGTSSSAVILVWSVRSTPELIDMVSPQYLLFQLYHIRERAFALPSLQWSTLDHLCGLWASHFRLHWYFLRMIDPCFSPTLTLLLGVSRSIYLVAAWAKLQ